MAESNAIVYVVEIGAETYVETLNGVLYTVDEIGFMADRILLTQEEIGEMADRIVYVVELSQFNTVKMVYMVTSISFMGINVTMGNLYEYAITVDPISYFEFLRLIEEWGI